MNKSESQIDFVKRQFKSHGKVSRNNCLKHYISRLGAIIFKLKDRHGMEFKGEYVESKNDFGSHRDFVYIWINPDVKIKSNYQFNYIDDDGNKQSLPISSDNFKNACSLLLAQIPMFLYALEEEVFDNFGSENSVLNDARFKDFRTYSNKK